AVTAAHAHAAEADGRDFQIAFSQFAFLHISLTLQMWRPDRFKSYSRPGLLIPESRSIALPDYSPALIRTSRLHNELPSRQLVDAWQVFANKGSHQRTLNVESEPMSAFVNFVCAPGCLVATL